MGGMGSIAVIPAVEVIGEDVVTLSGKILPSPFMTAVLAFLELFRLVHSR